MGKKFTKNLGVLDQKTKTHRWLYSRWDRRPSETDSTAIMPSKTFSSKFLLLSVFKSKTFKFLLLSVFKSNLRNLKVFPVYLT